jgi:hypothetical protein
MAIDVVPGISIYDGDTTRVERGSPGREPLLP